MTASSRSPRRIRSVGGALVVVLAMTLVAAAQPEPVEDPHDACPDPTNPAAPFTDRNAVPDVHVKNVDCAYNNDITVGFTDDSFRPRLAVRRDQFASFLVRTMQAGGVDLPPAEDQGFTDIEGNEHEDNINILAATGITKGTSQNRYSPRQFLPRDQIASFVLRAAAFIEDVSLASLQRDDGPFTDVPEGNTHRLNINGARHFNLTIGRTATTYEPDSRTRRDQMASFLVRLLASLRGDGLITPAERVTDVTIDEGDLRALNPPGTEHAISAEVTDRIDDPVADAQLRFEVYRGGLVPGFDVDTTAFTGPVKRSVVTTGADGRATFTYTGPNERALDLIVVCPSVGDSCEVEDANDEVDGTQFTGQPTVGADPHQTAVKIWSYEAESASASATGAELSDGEPDTDTRTALAEVAVQAPEDGRQATDSDELLDQELGPLGTLGLLRVQAIADLDYGGAVGRAETADVILLDGAIQADAIHAVAVSECPSPADASDEAASAGTHFANLRIGDTVIPAEPDPNTVVEIPGVATVTVRQVQDTSETNDRGEVETTVRGLHVELLDGGSIIVAEGVAGVNCVD